MNTKEPDIQFSTRSKIEKEGKISEVLATKIININAGFLGKVFGNAGNAPTNICGLVVTLLIITGIPISFANSKIDATDYWNKIFPVITAILGYLFGVGKRQK